MNDSINPDHYQRDGMECIDAISAAVQNLSGVDAFCTGAAIKYLWRWDEKGGAEDLRKAVWFINYIADQREQDDMYFEIKDAVDRLNQHLAMNNDD